MEFDWIWKAVVIVVGGTFLLRIAGRKSISQMTLAQTVIMVGIGSLLIQPLAGENIWVTLGVGSVLVLTLILMEYGQLKGDFIENLITGKSKIIIENGVIQERNLRKLRFTVDQLEMKLRQSNVAKISDIQSATLEPNGQVGFVLKPEAQPATKKEFLELSAKLDQMLQYYQMMEKVEFNSPPPSNDQLNQDNLFAEIKEKRHTNTPPKHLQ
ncbi:DUF421 domain-containing protein [Virgibacillus indicus]|uniref:DUF421 domain-containing protein n=1 Tax=Virgibacillus indicus TaxID=2024554 RepID=A0A265NB45_9BACI|nr:DUF421 domain-containing protein [Virgibacillus indicus]OZU89248.1 DUF421 domain-containing protein [Virgibacillus indicus]